MENEILKELWKAKDEIAEENNYNVEKIANKLKSKQKKHKHIEVDLSKRKKNVA